MSDLKENLARLDEAVPALPGKVAAVNQGAEALEQTASDLLAEFERKKGEVERLTAQVRQALVDLQGEGTDQEGQLRHSADALETSLENALKAILDDRQELTQAVDDAGEAFNSLQDHLTAAGSRTQTAQEAATQALADVKTGLEEGQAELETSVGASTAAVEAVGQAIEAGQTAVSDAVTTLTERMTELLDEAKGRLDQTERALQDATSGAEDGASESVADLEGRKDQLFQDLVDRVEHELRQRLDGALQAVVEALGRLSATVTEATDGIRADREAVGEQFDEVEQRMPPLESGVESVKQAANEVGIAFG